MFWCYFGGKVEPHLKHYDVHELPIQKVAGLLRDVWSHYPSTSLEMLLCDVLSLKICHIFLGHRWLWDHNAQYDARAYTYSIIKGNTKYTGTCALTCQIWSSQRIRWWFCVFTLVLMFLTGHSQVLFRSGQYKVV